MCVIYLAGGCFWGLQRYFDQFPGILETTVGYANGNGETPSYKEVCTQKLGYTETVKIKYDPMLICLSQILDLYMDVIDPIALNKQGEDEGTNYRTGIYYVDKADVRIIRHTMCLWQNKFKEDIQVEVLSLQNFYGAEEYHQKYLEKNEGGYCHIPFAKLHIKDFKPMTHIERMEREDLIYVLDSELSSIRENSNQLVYEMNQVENWNKEKREEYAKKIFGHVGEQVHIKSDFQCDYGKNIFFGNHVFVNTGCVFNDVGRIEIGNHVLIGPQVGIYSVNHPLNADLRRTGLEYASYIKIGDDCWIGGHASINPGVTLGNRVVVASGSVVTESFGDDVLIAGVPAKVVKRLD